MGHSVEPFTSISVAACVAVVVVAVVLLLRGPVTAKRMGRLALAALFTGFGIVLLLDILSIGATVGWDLAEGIYRARLTGKAPAWTSMLVEAILGPIFVMLGVVAARSAK